MNRSLFIREGTFLRPLYFVRRPRYPQLYRASLLRSHKYSSLFQPTAVSSTFAYVQQSANAGQWPVPPLSNSAQPGTEHTTPAACSPRYNHCHLQHTHHPAERSSAIVGPAAAGLRTCSLGSRRFSNWTDLPQSRLPDLIQSSIKPFG